MTKIKVMLVDDHTIVRAGLRALFDRQIDMAVVAETETVQGAAAIIEANRPDVLVLDLTLPGGGSLDLIRLLRARAVSAKILVLSMHDDPAYARSALGAGASGYVVKTIGELDLLAAVRAVNRGRIFIDLDDQTKTASVYSADARSARGAKGGSIAQLSEREHEVLALLGRGHSSQDIAERLDVSPKTVATYKARIGEKLGLKTTAEFVKYSHDNGLTKDSAR